MLIALPTWRFVEKRGVESNGFPDEAGAIYVL